MSIGDHAKKIGVKQSGRLPTHSPLFFTRKALGVGREKKTIVMKCGIWHRVRFVLLGCAELVVVVV